VVPEIPILGIRHGVGCSQVEPAATETEEKPLTVGNVESKRLQVGTMKVEIYPSSKSAGIAAASAVAAILKELLQKQEVVGVIFATGASQLDTLGALTELDDLPWQRVIGFHMDEYIGLSADHPASFRRYLRERLTEKVRMKEFFEIDGSAADPDQVCREYCSRLRAVNPQICLLGIGENGHLAFNDPPVADFADPLDAKVVHLDDVCREQQAAEGWFPSAADVPESAITLTIPTLLRVPTLIASVPGYRKANIVRRSLEDTISTRCPATILRSHPDVRLFLDSGSASELDVVLSFR
jgi:glucosamine-6-phosphate deaminase